MGPERVISKMKDITAWLYIDENDPIKMKNLKGKGKEKLLEHMFWARTKGWASAQGQILVIGKSKARSL